MSFAARAEGGVLDVGEPSRFALLGHLAAQLFQRLHQCRADLSMGFGVLFAILTSRGRERLDQASVLLPMGYSFPSD